MAQKTKRFVVVTPFANIEAVAGVCLLHGLQVRVIPTESGALITRDVPVPEYDEWDIRNITGPDPEEETANPSDDGPAVAAMLSQLSPYGCVLVNVTLVDDEEGYDAGISGNVQARRYQNGKAGEEIPSGLMLNALDPQVEKTVLGEDDDPRGTLNTADMTIDDLDMLINEGERRHRETAKSQAPRETESGAVAENEPAPQARSTPDEPAAVGEQEPDSAGKRELDSAAGQEPDLAGRQEGDSAEGPEKENHESEPQ
ncbi:Uncharacterised protein [Actinobaculum suis]|uniref:Uncharacterized protein n=1 Tax=Actinobaculum suis TaxID=1657 RepID=A0A0K9EU84_9ACTO|nr:hypothetical protein [Actinobaculum suis]KMY23422.1 hypothetical protein ACU19_04290 [Actinobaculum suis]OCA93808.1 hypothetical protein ACU20_08210 [Actinobaculum suis]OCA94101.1 hypothetical protein ACU21_08165 [Actinobaculum suis]VDG76398.1 Uncharacterised protein [Actinobaculum suis]